MNLQDPDPSCQKAGPEGGATEIFEHEGGWVNTTMATYGYGWVDR